MILNDEAISALAGRIQENESSISSHWRAALDGFQYQHGEVVGAEGADGHTPKKSFSQQLRHHVLLSPFRRMGNRFSNFKEYYHTGKAVVKRRGGVFDLGMMRQVLTLSQLTENASPTQLGLPIVVIGDGWGAMTSLILACLPQAKVVVVNLSSMLLVDLVYIRKSLPNVGVMLARSVDEYCVGLDSNEVRVIAVSADDFNLIRQGPIGLAINIVSMQEMDPPVIASYFAALRDSPNPETLFYCCNRTEKTLPDGTIVRFGEYPWKSDDKVLLDELCPWHQYYLRLRPPFHGKYDGPIWHRLVAMDKG